MINTTPHNPGVVGNVSQKPPRKKPTTPLMVTTMLQKNKWYIFTGKKRGSNWNVWGKMDFVLDGKPHKCVWIDDDTDDAQAEFEDDPTQTKWYWGRSAELFIEIDPKKPDWEKIMEARNDAR